jgi:hypothetical protein
MSSAIRTFRQMRATVAIATVAFAGHMIPLRPRGMVLPSQDDWGVIQAKGWRRGPAPDGPCDIR